MTEVMDNVINKENGKIKKSDLMRDALRNAPKLGDAQVYHEIKMFAARSIKGGVKYLFLNSRDINYCTIFDIQNTNDADKVATHIIGYLKESFYISCEAQEPGLVPVEDLRYSKMDDVRDIDNTNKHELGLYIGVDYFKLTSADALVEVIQ